MQSARVIASGSVAAFLIVAAALPSDARKSAQVISLVQEMRIDGNVHNLDAPTWLYAGRDGIIAIQNAEQNRVLFFDSTGRHLGQFGKAGEAPGEFRHVSSAGWVGDSLWVYDILQTRATIIAPGLTLGRVAEFSTVTPSPLAMYTDGRFLLRLRGNLLARTAVNSLTTENQVAQVPGSRNISVAKGDGTLTIRSPFALDAVQQVSSHGARVATLTTVFEGSPANVMHLVVQGAGGDTVYMRDYPFTPEPLPPGTFERTTAQLMSYAAGDTAMEAAIRRQVQVPRAHVPFTKLVVADDGSAWILLRPEIGGRQRAMLIDSRGTFFGTALLPPATTPMAVSPTHMWALERAGGASNVVRYRVVMSR